MTAPFKPGDAVISRSHPYHGTKTVASIDGRQDGSWYVYLEGGESGPADDYADPSERDAIAKARRAVPPPDHLSEKQLLELRYDGRIPNEEVARVYGRSVARLYGGS